MELLDFISKAPIIWFFIGLAFLLLEFLMPGLIVLFFGFGAWITAICTLIFELGLNAQLVVFIGTSILSLIFLRKYFKRIFVGKDEKAVDEVLEEFVGKTVIAESDFEKGRKGKVTFKGALWEALSETDIKKGDQLKIIGKESIVLKVEALDQN
ncbi:MAG: NfeD family protein [Ignavibacteriaceae bacterium]|jgi:membrane protein implicated in regulation of membrane protease activity